MISTNKVILEKISSIVSDILDCEKIELTENMTAADVPGWDSLAHVQIIYSCETSIGARFTLEEISGLNTVGDLANIIKKYSDLQ